jgi:hypothetical protein
MSTQLRERLETVRKSLRALSPITRGTLAVYALSIPLQWLVSYAPGETPYELAQVAEVDEPIIAMKFLTGGERVLVASLVEPDWSVLDWTMSGELVHSADLQVLSRTKLDLSVMPHQGLFAEGRLDLLAREGGELVHHRFDGKHSRTVAPDGAMWIAPDGEPFAPPAGFDERAKKELGKYPRAEPVWRTGRWAMLGSEGQWYRDGDGDGDGDGESIKASDALLIFDAQTGAPHKSFSATNLRKVFTPPRWDGFFYTIQSGLSLGYIACDGEGCSSGGVDLVIDYGEITAADYHPEAERIAVCMGEILWLYEASHDYASLLLGRGVLPQPCTGAWIASPDTVLVRLEDLSIVVARFKERR